MALHDLVFGDLSIGAADDLVKATESGLQSPAF